MHRLKMAPPAEDSRREEPMTVQGAEGMTVKELYHERFVASIEKSHRSAGRTQMLRHLAGKKLTHRQAILAKCADCMGWNADGRLDCGV